MVINLQAVAGAYHPKTCTPLITSPDLANFLGPLLTFFSAKEREARSSGGFTLKEGGAQRPRG